MGRMVALWTLRPGQDRQDEQAQLATPTNQAEDRQSVTVPGPAAPAFQAPATGRTTQIQVTCPPFEPGRQVDFIAFDDVLRAQGDRLTTAGLVDRPPQQAEVAVNGVAVHPDLIGCFHRRGLVNEHPWPGQAQR